MGIAARDMASRSARRARPSRTRTALIGGAVAATTLAMIAAAAPAALADTSPTPAPQRLGSAPHLPRGAVRTAAPAGDTPIDLGVVLSPRDPAGLKKFIADVSTPGSPLFHHYLKTGRFGAAFGASGAAVDRVTAALKAQGLKPGPLAADGLTLPVRTTVGAAAKAFDTGFTGYRTSDGRSGVTNTSAPAVAAGVAPVITGITGLTTAAQLHPHFTVDPKAKVAAAPSGNAVAPRVNGKTPTLCSSIKSLLSQNGYSDTQNYWSARSLASAYGMADQPNVGTGVTVGVFELENYSTKDVAAYQSCYGTKVPVSAVKVDGGPKAAANPAADVGIESALDIEDLIGLVPQASLLVYQGPDAAGATYQNVLDVYQKMVDDNRAQVLSSSWGGCELDTPPSFMDAESLIFEQAAAQGQTVTAATGDSGSADCWYDADGDGSNDDGPNGLLLSTDDPASQPYVLGVGGTNMTGSGGTNQSTWNAAGRRHRRRGLRALLARRGHRLPGGRHRPRLHRRLRGGREPRTAARSRTSRRSPTPGRAICSPTARRRTAPRTGPSSAAPAARPRPGRRSSPRPTRTCRARPTARSASSTRRCTNCPPPPSATWWTAPTTCRTPTCRPAARTRPAAATT